MSRKPSPVVPVAQTIATVRLELIGLRALATTLQETLGQLAPGLSGQAITSMQGLDLMTQRLDGIATFLAAFGPALPVTWTSEPGRAAGAVMLHDLAQRLAHAPREAACGVACDGADAGVLDLFETDGD